MGKDQLPSDPMGTEIPRIAKLMSAAKSWGPGSAASHFAVGTWIHAIPIDDPYMT